MGIEALHRIHGALHLGSAYVRRPVDHLPLQVREAYRIVVYDAEGADPGGSEVLDQGGTQAAGPDHENTSGFQLLLPRAAYIPQDEMAGIAFDFI